MRINYEFKADDPMVIGHLRAPEIADVQTWQVNTEYTFEFHLGHGTGYPIYIRPNGCGDTSNIPKIDTLNKFATSYDKISKIANSEKLGGLSNNARAEILAIIANEWGVLQELSKRIWDGERVIEGPSVLDLWAEEEGSDTGQHNVEISRTQLRKILGGY